MLFPSFSTEPLEKAGTWHESEHPRDEKGRFATKWRRAIQLGHSLTSMRRKYNKDMKLPGMPRDKVTALMVGLIDKGQFRIGNDESAEERGVYGLTTLKREHVAVKGNTITFKYLGKKNVPQYRKVTDKLMADTMREVLKIEGGMRSGGKKDAKDDIFKFINTQGDIRTVSPYNVNGYIEKWGVTAKDFRTYHASRKVYEYLQNAPGIDVEKDIENAIKKAAKDLGHEPRTCKRAYVDPNILKLYRKLKKSLWETGEWTWEEFGEAFEKYYGTFFDFREPPAPEKLEKAAGKGDDILERLMTGVRKRFRDKMKSKLAYKADGQPLPVSALKTLEETLKKFMVKPEQWAESAVTRATVIGKLIGEAEKGGRKAAKVLFDTLPVTVERVEKPFTVRTATGGKLPVVPLQSQELTALRYAQVRAGDYINTKNQDLINGVRQAVMQATQERWDAGKLAGVLFDKFGAANRDWRRIAITELAMAGNNGYLSTLDDGESVIIQESADMCKHCRRLNHGRIFRYTTNPRDADERNDVWIDKTNVGRKVKDWVPTVPLHPHCRGRYTRVNTTFYKMKEGKLTLKTADEILAERGVR